MFPSGNYFRDIPCPFFNRVTCPRPYCHYKHATSSSTTFNSNNTTNSTSLPIPPDANETLNKLISQISSSTTSNMTSMHSTVDLASLFQTTLLQSLTTAFTNALNAVPSTVVASVNPQDVSEKLTQAIGEIATKLTPQVPSKNVQSQKDPIPSYRPTPIAELERRKREQQTTKTMDTDDDPYTKAIFSPVSSTIESIDEPKKSLSRLNSSENVNKSKSNKTEKKDCWVTPPTRREKVSTTNLREVEEKKKLSREKSTSNERTEKKSRLVEIDLDRVKSNPKIKIDVDSDEEKKISIKRSSSTGSNENPEKKMKFNSMTSIEKCSNSKKSQDEEKDDELALIDFALNSTKPKSIPNTAQQLVTRYKTPSNPTNLIQMSHTRAETATNGRRIAHQPKTNLQSNSTLVIQPIIDPGPIGQKIPIRTRQDCLNLFLKEFQKQNRTDGSLSDRLRKMEKDIFDKSTNKNTYLNFSAQQLRRIRAEIPNKTQTNTAQTSSKKRLVVSHSALLSAGQTESTSSNNKKSTDVDLKSLTDNEIYTLMAVYRAKLEELSENGYPEFSLDFPEKVLIKHKNPIYKSTVKLPTSDPMVRLCCRCGKTYRVDEHGEHLTVEECNYHWGRLRSQRVNGQIDKRYSCCESSSGAFGCSVARCHVHETDDSKPLDGFVKTEPLKTTLSEVQSPGVYAIDCEMCYTTNGLELVRVSVVNHKLEMVIDSLVRPSNTILDYNTRWSGIQQADLEHCHVRLEDIQRRLLKLFNDKTLLIGHSLESDLKALKIVHESVIDTSLIFPHARGKPFKRALKTLASEFLMKIVQESANGHNPIEDATICMELMLWKIRGDLKGVTNRR